MGLISRVSSRTYRKKMSDLSQRDLEVQNAKAALIGDGTYDCLAKVIRKLLDEKPANAAEQLSSIVDRVKLETTTSPDNLSSLQICADKSQQAELAEKIQDLFTNDGNAEAELEEDEEAGANLPNLQETAFYFKQGGIGLCDEEWTRIYLAMKQLCEKEPTMEQCRFWGKIMGLKANYYIVEGKLPPQDDDDEEESENDGSENNDDGDEDGLPKSTWKPVPDVEPEGKGLPGTNMYTYWVTNEPGTGWVQLDSVKPAHISIARQITKFFTGDLEANVDSFPVFPGQEKHLLRVQIARITHGAYVAPMTYYQLDEEADLDDPEASAVMEPQLNPDFEGVILRDLLDPSLQAWVHARPFILNQGRCDFKDPNKKEGEEEFDEDEDEEELMQEADREIGPPQLTALSEDLEVTGIPAWSISSSSSLSHSMHQIAIIKSNLWPGAAAYCNGHKFDNIYLGYGQKYTADNFSPASCQVFEVEYVQTEVVEESDPTVEQENALKAAEEANNEDEGDDRDDDDDEE